MTTASIWNKGHWSQTPASRPHEIDSVHYAEETGADCSLVCHCGWTYTGPTPEHVEKAYVAHRKSLGLLATTLNVGFQSYSQN